MNTTIYPLGICNMCVRKMFVINAIRFVLTYYMKYKQLGLFTVSIFTLSIRQFYLNQMLSSFIRTFHITNILTICMLRVLLWVLNEKNLMFISTRFIITLLFEQKQYKEIEIVNNLCNGFSLSSVIQLFGEHVFWVTAFVHTPAQI